MARPLSARLACDAMRRTTSPRRASIYELGRCGAERGATELCVGAALASHGRGKSHPPAAQEITARILLSTVQLGLAGSAQSAFLVSPVWLGAVVARGMSNGMTAISAGYRALLSDDASVARRPGSS